MSRRILMTVFSVLVFAEPTAAHERCEDQIRLEQGETLARIARRCDIPLSALLRANPDLPNPDIVTPGTVLNMPDGDLVRAEVRGYVESAPGETLADVARRHEVPLALLIALNPAVGTGELDPETRIALPSSD